MFPSAGVNSRTKESKIIARNANKGKKIRGSYRGLSHFVTFSWKTDATILTQSPLGNVYAISTAYQHQQNKICFYLMLELS